VAETDLDGTIRHVNDMFCIVSGYNREESNGQTHRIVNSGHHSREFWINVFKTITETGMWQGTICNRRKNGDYYWVDTNRLRQILMNLIGNAVKFTEQGQIRILVRKSELADREYLQFDIEDTGPGMSHQQADKIFKAFSQADTSVTRQHGGTGLGLVISRKLARMMDGEVSLAWTEKGKGTCFQFTLPIKPLPQTKYRISRLEDESADRKKKTKITVADEQLLTGTRILLAEDGPDNQRLISFILKKTGASVEIADNGAIAYQKYSAAKETKEPFDILLTDMQMPEMDGYSLARKLRAENETLPIIALTAHAMDEDHQKCLDAGCDDYLSKPINRKVLTQTLFEWKTKKSSPYRTKPSS